MKVDDEAVAKHLQSQLRELCKVRDAKYKELCRARREYDENVMYGNVVGMRNYGTQCRAAVMEAECLWLRAQVDVDVIRHQLVELRMKKGGSRGK